jgi:arylsulfatase A-like enzyme
VIGKPNLLFVFADEMRQMDMSCSGNTVIRTPNMDRLAKEGAMFSRMYTTNPVCSPARSSLMTGYFPHNTGVWKNGIRLKEDVACIAELTSAAGYYTGHIGKWHLDGGSGNADQAFVPPDRHRGFQYWAGYEHGDNYWNGKYYTESQEPVYFAPDTYEPDGQTDLAIEFIRQNAHRPWHLDLSWGPPHFPLEQAKQEDTQRFDPEMIKLQPNVPAEFREEATKDYIQYYAMIENLDWNLGKLLKLLDKLNLSRNTIVVFTSDHGDMLLSHGMHYKRRPQDESAKVPFLIRYPEKIAPGKVLDFPASLVDCVPTFLELMNIDPILCEGKSLAPALSSTTKEFVMPESVYIQGAMLGCRAYDPQHVKAPWRAVVTERYKICYVKKDDSRLEIHDLYDLQNDPYEQVNLVKDPGNQPVVEHMNLLFKDWVEKTQDHLFQIEMEKKP